MITFPACLAIAPAIASGDILLGFLLSTSKSPSLSTLGYSVANAHSEDTDVPVFSDGDCFDTLFGLMTPILPDPVLAMPKLSSEFFKGRMSCSVFSPRYGSFLLTESVTLLTLSSKCVDSFTGFQLADGEELPLGKKPDLKLSPSSDAREGDDKDMSELLPDLSTLLPPRDAKKAFFRFVKDCNIPRLSLLFTGETELLFHESNDE